MPYLLDDRDSSIALLSYRRLEENVRECTWPGQAVVTVSKSHPNAV